MIFYIGMGKLLGLEFLLYKGKKRLEFKINLKHLFQNVLQLTVCTIWIWGMKYSIMLAWKKEYMQDYGEAIQFQHLQSSAPASILCKAFPL